MKRRADYSQNFLRSPKLVASLIARSNLTSNDLVYDFGAGSGVISAELAKEVARVVAIEYEPKTVEILRRNMQPLTNVKVIQGDVMQLPFPTEPFKIFANIPFHLSSPIVQRFINTPNAPQAVYLIVQRQFGRKLIANDTSFFTSQLGMIIGAEYAVKSIKNLRKTDFWPHPAVDTMCIEMVKRGVPLVPSGRLKAYRTFTEECFSDPKKFAKLPLNTVGAKVGDSPSRMSLERWVNLFLAQKIY